MPNDSKKAVSRIDAKNTLSTSRRHLLKAAATVAPVIATLPGGAALANASTHQCIITARENSNMLPMGKEGDWISEGPDEWIRVSVPFHHVEIEYNVGSNGQPDLTTAVREYYVILVGGETRYIAADYDSGSETWDDVPDALQGQEVVPPGSEANTPSGTPPGPTTSSFDFTDRDRVWIDSWTKNNATEMRDVLLLFTESGSGPIPTNGVHMTGIYPASKRGDEPFVDNMGMNGSCLCSVDPQYRDTGIC